MRGLLPAFGTKECSEQIRRWVLWVCVRCLVTTVIMAELTLLENSVVGVGPPLSWCEMVRLSRHSSLELVLVLLGSLRTGFVGSTWCLLISWLLKLKAWIALGLVRRMLVNKLRGGLTQFRVSILCRVSLWILFGVECIVRRVCSESLNRTELLRLDYSSKGPPFIGLWKIRMCLWVRLI